MKKILYSWIILFTTLLQAQITLIPDPGFETELIVLGIDSDGEVNGQVLTSDIENVTTLIIIQPFHTISDMTGIEDFTALEVLEIWQQDFTTINLVNNINLIELHLSTIPLESLDISNNINLIELDLLTPVLQELELENNINLEIVIIDYSSLTEIDIYNNLLLKNFRLFGNHELEYVNLQNGNNAGVLTIVEINFSNENVICVQVDDPVAVMEGNPPYEYWDIDESITISDNCGVFSVDNFVLSSQITLYPNPVQEILNIDNNSSYTINTIQVYDILGRLVLQDNNPKGQLDVSNIASGILFVQLETDKGVLVKKVVKE